MEEEAVQNKTPLRRPVRPLPAQEEIKKERISIIMATMMLVTSLLIDCFCAVLTLFVVGAAISPVIQVAATFAFFVWFWILGVSFVKSPKKLASMGGQAILELIPVVNTLPALTLGIFATIVITRSEDKGGIIGKAAGIASGKLKV